MAKIEFDYKNAARYLGADELEGISAQVTAAHKLLTEKKGLGNDFTGFLNLPQDYDRDEFERVKKAAEKIRSTSDVLVVIGIGGSYLGAKAAIDMLCGTFYNQKPDDVRGGPQIFFAGNNISPEHMAEVMELLKGRDFSVNVISKSGTTTEPAIAFRFFKAELERRYGTEGAASRIYATTDKGRGALYKMAVEKGYETFVIPDDIGGRYSVLTPVGLLPIAATGVDIDKIMQGALEGMKEYSAEELSANMCYQYAAVRNSLYRKGKTIEILVNYDSSLHYFGEWWKQLFGESEGKDHKGIFPASVDFSSDLHSMGQYIQDGLRNIFETVINVENYKCDIEIQSDAGDADGLNYLAGKTVGYVNRQAFLGTVMAHDDGGVPNLVLNIEKQDEYTFGKLVFFFEKACAISGYLLGVNPFDQPGVEAYKKNMFALLGKAGYEKEREELLARMR